MKARKAFPHLVIEIETANTGDVEKALGTEADILMLDNMDNKEVEKSIALVDKSKYTEVSGNIDNTRLIDLARFGADFISMGALTHTLRPLDLSLLIK
jgi:nicotinate-nucleotide pyrophosphorylase (carboxylating)